MNRLKAGIVIATVCTFTLIATGNPVWLLACIVSGGYVGLRKARLDTGAVEG